MSKMDSKHDGLKCDSARYISNFAEKEWLSKQNLTLIKAYFMKIWADINSNTTVTTLNDLRKETYINSYPKGRPIDALPPTSSVVHGHIRCAYFFVRMSITF